MMEFDIKFHIFAMKAEWINYFYAKQTNCLLFGDKTF